MMKSISLKQPKPLKVKILGALILALIPFALVNNENPFFQIVTMAILSIILLGYTVSYQIKKDFDNYKHITLFGLTVWKQKLDIDFPEYISVFSASYKQDNEWGTVSALGTRIENKLMVIRFFCQQKHFTVLKINNYNKAIDKANELGEMLNVKIYDATKE